ncbi:MAG: hypothetical protein EXR51_11755 [Dehalococcoidia bacterium]|nr:hypothetical protein [Dehalococcoidia bacterium]
MAVPQRPDPLGVRATTARVVTLAQSVSIDVDAVAALARRWKAEGVTAPAWQPQFHFFDGTHRSVNWLLTLDAVNFSFWSHDPTERWEVDYGGRRLDGYWALAAAFKRAVEEGTRLWDARVLADLSQGDIYRVFRGTGLIPMITDRLTNLREVGSVLLERHRGQAINLVQACEHSAAALARSLAQEFRSFADVAVYEGEPVVFLKRAQLLVSDLWGAFRARGWGRFDDMEALTAFADYKLPQLLREYGVLRYTSTLAGRIDQRAVILAGSPEEVEIRAATVQAVDLLSDCLRAEGIEVLPFQVDWLLWQSAQGVTMAHPYHLTRTIFY